MPTLEAEELSINDKLLIVTSTRDVLRVDTNNAEYIFLLQLSERIFLCRKEAEFLETQLKSKNGGIPDAYENLSRKKNI